MWQVKTLLLRKCQWCAVINYSKIIMWREISGGWKLEPWTKCFSGNWKQQGCTAREKKNPAQWKFWESNNINNWTFEEAIQDWALLGFLIKMTSFTFTKFQKQRRKEKGKGKRKAKKEKEYATGNFNSYSKYWQKS